MDVELQEAGRRVEELRAQINEYSRLYYEEDAPAVEDDEFDALTRELRGLESRYPQLITPDSYTQRVQGAVSAQFSPVRHEAPLESLQDVFSLEELREFDRRVRETAEAPVYVVEPKIDGCPSRWNMWTAGLSGALPGATVRWARTLPIICALSVPSRRS